MIASGRARPIGQPLVLEDNLIIAMEIEEILLDIGYPGAQLCGSIPTAHTILRDKPIGLAVLDIYLGSGETSLELAQALAGRGIPFIFVSGYDGHAEVTGRFPGVPVVGKPFVAADLRRALAGIGVC